PEKGLRVVGGFGQRSAGKNLRGIRRVRYLPAAQWIDQRTQLERVLRRRQEIRGWARENALPSEHRHCTLLSSSRIELPGCKLPDVRHGHPRSVPRRRMAARFPEGPGSR